MKQIGVFCSSSNNLETDFYRCADQLGRWMGERDKTLVYGGANCGLMESLAKAVHETGGHVIGVVPQILIDHQRVSTFLDEQIVTENLTDRKQQIIALSDAIVALPGSVGTLDEAFTLMAANTIGIEDKPVIFWNINGFWDPLFVLFDSIVARGAGTRPFDEYCYNVKSFDELVGLLA